MMKPLNQLTSTEKARTLHRLFPKEIPALLNYLQQSCKDLSDNREQHRKNWGQEYFTFDAWLNLALQTDLLIEKHRDQLAKSCDVFADQLCFSYTVAFVNRGIIQYASQICTDEKFKLAVELLYK